MEKLTNTKSPKTWSKEEKLFFHVMQWFAYMHYGFSEYFYEVDGIDKLKKYLDILGGKKTSKNI